MQVTGLLRYIRPLAQDEISYILEFLLICHYQQRQCQQV